MRSRLTLAVGCCVVGYLVAVAIADEPAIRVTCPAVSYDDHNERGVNGPDGPHPVVLMVIGKTIKSEGKATFQKRGRAPGGPDQSEPTKLKVERVLFGSPPGETILIPRGHEHFPDDADRVSHVYGLVSTRGRGKVGYAADDYYLSYRTYSLQQLPKAEALARARLDGLVLSQLAIVVGRPNAAALKLATEDDDPFAPPKPASALITVEQVLHGALRAGDQIAVTPDRDPIPLAGEGPFIYFLEESRESDGGKKILYKVETRWALETLDTVKASLARRKDYPIKEIDAGGEKFRQQEILFVGPRAAALELLQEDRNPLEILGARRILTDGQAALPDVVQLIEKHLWQPRLDGVADFRWQENLIQILAILENHRTDGHIVRLIDEVLTKAEQGATFPLKVIEREVHDGLPRRLRYGDSYDVTSNHSLGWLLLTLNERAASRLCGERLIKLRDLAAYGWKDEAQIALDELHIEDHLTLAKVEPQSQGLPTKKWQAGFRGDGVAGSHFTFSPDKKYFAAVDSTVRIWNTADWSLAAEFEQNASIERAEFTPDSASLITCGGGVVSVFERWDWRTGKSMQSYSGLNSSGSFDLSNDGRWLVASEGYEGSLFVFDVQSGRVVTKQPKENWYHLAWQPAGKRFLGKLKDRWTIGDTEKSERRVLNFVAHAVAWAQDGLWSLEDGAKIEAKPLKPGEAAPGFNRPDPFGPPPPFHPPAIKPASRQPATEISSEDLPPLLDPFGSRRGDHLSVLRLRRLDDKFPIALERQLSFAATELLVSGDHRSVVVLNEQQAEVFAAPDWKSVASWKIPNTRRVREPFSARVEQYVLSNDGQWLAIARENAYPQLLDARTGKVLSLGSGHSNEIVGLNFADPNTLRTRDVSGTVIRWNVTTGEQLPALRDDLAATPETDDSRRRHSEVFVSEDGRIWEIEGHGGGAYGRYTSFVISVRPRGTVRPGGGDPFDDGPRDNRPIAELQTVGEIPTRWRQTGPNGLVPGGKYLHIGTQVFERGDLKPISAANVHGDIDQIQFTSDGRRYLLVTTERQSRPAPLGLGHIREEVAQRVRIHDTASGQTLVCIPTRSVKLLAIAGDQSRIATVNDRQELQVWKLEK